ncbi:iron transporter FeoA [candidate division KSB3 bacterium]|uniref:Iron transporter FeoA n=1 Tax=candidate division KSB3 bacterium TaxID=2044937 RepID=A0A2G6E6T3_9BACT|nr:MAG: iron transporter FeoA [candidate division KSB3 bacterium]PIE29986.1 MAG: iron transporter FeoA [candidate division KSB3 bacterium]
MTLDMMQPNQECVIRDVTLDGAELQRLLDMGFIEGTPVKVIRNAPLMDPLDVEIRGYLIALRRHEASGVEVEAL